MCCAKKKLAKLEAEVAELKAAVERLQAAILPPVVSVSSIWGQEIQLQPPPVFTSTVQRAKEE